MSTASHHLVMAEAVDVTIHIGDVCVARDLSLAIRAGEFWGVLGQNGVGKTTLLKALAGLHPVASGQIRLNDQPIESLTRREIAKHLGMLTQETHYAFDATCEQTALVGRHPHLKPWMKEQASDHALAHQALQAMALGHLAHRSCMNLSGGESRRLATAALLVQDPEVFLLDEPTNHLDPANQVSVLNVLGQHIRTRQKCAMMALHEVNLATCYCSHCLMLFGDGQWLAGPTDELLTAENLSRLYQCHMRLVDDGEHKVFAVAG